MCIFLGKSQSAEEIEPHCIHSNLLTTKLLLTSIEAKLLAFYSVPIVSAGRFSPGYYCESGKQKQQALNAMESLSSASNRIQQQFVVSLCSVDCPHSLFSTFW